MILFYGVFAILTTWIWVEYFKLLGVCKKDKMIFVYSTFTLGLLSYIIFINSTSLFYKQFIFAYENDVVNHLLSSLIKYGLIGELLKVLPIVVVYGFFRKYLNQPIDVLLLCTVSALGFSAGENIFYSKEADDLHFIDEKIVLGTLGEMFSISPIAFALMKYQFYQKVKNIYYLVSMFFMAVVLHGAYDFWIYYENTVAYGFVITIVYFLFLISLYAVTITNALNFDSNFTYKTQIDFKKNKDRLVKLYGILLLIQFFVIGWGLHFSLAIENLKNIFLFAGLVTIVAIYRLNKLKRIKKKWNKLRIELPFELYRIDTFNGRSAKYKFRFKGETFKEGFVDNYLGEFCTIYPLSKRNSFIMKHCSAFIEKKVFLKNDETFYLVKIFGEDKDDYMLVKPKTSGKLLVKRKYPIVALFSILDVEDINDKNLTALDFQFREWVFIKHR